MPACFFSAHSPVPRKVPGTRLCDENGCPDSLLDLKQELETGAQLSRTHKALHSISSLQAWGRVHTLDSEVKAERLGVQGHPWFRLSEVNLDHRRPFFPQTSPPIKTMKQKPELIPLIMSSPRFHPMCGAFLKVTAVVEKQLSG